MSGSKRVAMGLGSPKSDIHPELWCRVSRGQGQAGGDEERMLYPHISFLCQSLAPRNAESPPIEEHVGNESFSIGFRNYMDCVPQLRGKGRAAALRP